MIQCINSEASMRSKHFLCFNNKTIRAKIWYLRPQVAYDNKTAVLSKAEHYILILFFDISDFKSNILQSIFNPFPALS